MKLFQQFREIMPFLVGYDALEEYGFVAPNAFRKYLCTFTSLFGYVILLSATFLMGGFLLFEAETFDEIHDHFPEFTTALNDTIYFLSMYWICKRFLDLNDNYEQMIKKRSFNDEKRKLYNKASKFVETSSNYLYIGHVRGLIPLTTIPYLLMSYFNYYTTDLPPNEVFTLPFIIWTIFDWRTPTAYIFVFIFEFIATAYVLIVALVFLIHGIGSLWIFIAFVDDIKADLNILDIHQKNKVSDVRLYEYLCEFVRFHTEIKQLFGVLNSTYALPIVLNLLLTASTMAVVLVSLQTELARPEIDLPAILQNITITFALITLLVVIFSACEELKGRFEDSNVYLRCKWYQYPTKMKQILPIIIIDSQNSDVFRIFGSVTASRETCNKVIKSGFLTIIGLHTLSK